MWQSLIRGTPKSPLGGAFFYSGSIQGFVDLWPLAELCEVSCKGENMLHYSILFLVIALVAAFLGFGLVAGTAALLAKICFVVFLVLFIVTLITGRGRTPV
jgi:uncharacterized membrane protein YtjA (UPF0391 family)